MLHSSEIRLSKNTDIKNNFSVNSCTAADSNRNFSVVNSFHTASHFWVNTNVAEEFSEITEISCIFQGAEDTAHIIS